MSTPIFLVRWRLRRMGYWLIRSHCSCRPQCYFAVKRTTDAVAITDMTPTETRKNAVDWVKQHHETQVRMGLIEDDEDPGWFFAKFRGEDE